MRETTVEQQPFQRRFRAHFDCNLYGDVKIHCEMNFEKLGTINDDAKFTKTETGQTELEANNIKLRR